MFQSTYDKATHYLVMFTSLSVLKGVFSVLHRHKLNQIPLARYETESTLGTVMKIQMQFNFLFIHLAILFTEIPDISTKQWHSLLFLIILSSLIYVTVLILTDYRWLLKIYRYENHLLQNDYPVIEFLAIQIFMMLGVAVLIAIQWFIIPIISDLMYLLLCVYRVPSIHKCHCTNQKPNLTYFSFMEDYCMLLFYTYYRGCTQNFQQLETDIGMCITLSVFMILQQTLTIFQYYYKPKLFTQKEQVFVAEDFRKSGIYKCVDSIQFDCAICLQGVEGSNQLQQRLDTTESLALTICGHYFHEECLVAWLKVKKLCPICRNEL